MNVRRLAVSAAAVAVMAGAGLAVTASPAAAMPKEDCRRIYNASDYAALMMDYYVGWDHEMWSDWYTAWLFIEDIKAEKGC